MTAANILASSAVNELCNSLYCASDPIRYRGYDMALEDLSGQLSGLACDVRISYYGGKRGRVRWIKGGTLLGMLRDRRELQREKQQCDNA